MSQLCLCHCVASVRARATCNAFPQNQPKFFSKAPLTCPEISYPACKPYKACFWCIQFPWMAPIKTFIATDTDIGMSIWEDQHEHHKETHLSTIRRNTKQTTNLKHRTQATTASNPQKQRCATPKNTTPNKTTHIARQQTLNETKLGPRKLDPPDIVPNMGIPYVQLICGPY